MKKKNHFCFRLILILAVFYFRGANGQRNRTFPFVSVGDVTVAFDDATTKTFTSTLEVERATGEPLQLSRLQRALETFYNATTNPPGLIRINIQELNDTTAELTLVTFELVYNFATLSAGVGDAAGAISVSIGSINPVQRGLSRDAYFQSNKSISSRGFTFVGESLCETIGCTNGEYLICSEVRNEVDTLCTSLCKRSYCTNDGLCHHDDDNEPPTCSCVSTTSSWYVGRRCELLVQMWMFVLFFVLVAVALVIIVAVACVCTRNLDQKDFRKIAAERKHAMTLKNSISVTSIMSIKKLSKKLTVATAPPPLLRRRDDSESEIRYVNNHNLTVQTRTTRDSSLTTRNNSSSSSPPRESSRRERTPSSMTSSSSRSGLPTLYNTTSLDNTNDQEVLNPSLGRLSSVSSGSAYSDSDDGVVDLNTLQRQFNEAAAAAAARSSDNSKRQSVTLV